MSLLDPDVLKSAATIVAGLGAVLTATSRLLGTWSEERGRYARLGLRTKATAFWEAWYRARAQVAARGELPRLKSEVRAHLDDLVTWTPGEDPVASFLTTIVRATLFYPPSTAWAWPARIAFYLGAAFTIWVVVLIVHDLGARQFSADSASLLLGTGLIVVAVSYAIARWIERRPVRAAR